MRRLVQPVTPDSVGRLFIAVGVLLACSSFGSTQWSMCVRLASRSTNSQPLDDAHGAYDMGSEHEVFIRDVTAVESADRSAAIRSEVFAALVHHSMTTASKNSNVRI